MSQLKTNYDQMKTISDSNEMKSAQTKVWHGKDYKDGSWVQYEMGLKFLELVDLNNKIVIDAGCGTGKITYKIARRNAKSVTGFDLSENMILSAKETNPSTIIYPKNNNIVMIDFCVGSIDTIILNKCDIVVSFFVIHWVVDTNCVESNAHSKCNSPIQGDMGVMCKKEKAIVNMYNHLNDNGEFLFTISTEKNRIVESKTFSQTYFKLVEKYPTLENSIKNEFDIYQQNATYDSNNLKTLLNNLNCSVLKNEVINFKPTFKDRNHLEKSIRPLIFGQPFMKLLPIEEHDNVFNIYVECLITNLEQSDDGSLNYPMSTTLVHIKKI